MTIYDLKLYGVHFPRLIGDSKVILSQNMEEAYAKAPKHFRFEATVLKHYGSKQDVVQMQFVDGRLEYVTLFRPFMYLDDGEWIATEDGAVAEAFFQTFNKICQDAVVSKMKSLFDMEFYGIMESMPANGIPKMTISLNKEEILRSMHSSLDFLMFKVKILPCFKGNKYVMVVSSDTGKKYMPLFNNKMCYDEKQEKWVVCPESPIPNKILKCYVKHLNG